MARRRSFRAKSGRELKRRGASRDVPDRVLIVTEGARTEPDYFRKLIADLGLTTAKVRIIGDGGSAPINVVEDGKKALEQDSDFEQVYFVFDRDSHATYDEALKVVKTLQKEQDYRGKTIRAATSVPCFEIWFLMHVSASRKPYAGKSPGADLLSELRKNGHFSDYVKGKCVQFEVIKKFRDTAKSRAVSFLEQAEKNGEPEFHENPSTRVHLVVGALETLSKVNKKA